MKLRAKTLISAALGFSGVMSLLEHLTVAGQRVVLTLHHVLPAEEVKNCYNPYLALSAPAFEELLGFLRERFNVLGLEELLSPSLRNSRRPSCALTFDDGWEDNYRVAFPILKKHRVPAIIFLATGYIGSLRRLPEERLFRLWDRANQAGRGAELRKDLDARFPERNGSNNKPLSHYHSLSKTVPYRMKIAILEELEQKYGAELVSRSQFLNWEQVNEMAANGIEFGSHTVHHMLLAQEVDSDVANEIIESRKTIAERVGAVSDVLAYPSGNFDDRVVRVVAESGYRAALTTIPGALSPAGDPYRLPRIAIADDVLSDVHGDFSGHRVRLHFVRSLFQGRRA